MYYVGIDIGGTTIKAGMVDESGVVIEVHRSATIVDNLEGLLSSLVELYGKFPAQEIDGVGVGVPGLRSDATCVIETSPNIPCLQRVELEKLLAARLGALVISENDANAGA